MTSVTLPRRVKILILGASVLGTACVVLRVPQIRAWDARDLAAAAVIVILTITAERCSIQSSPSSSKATIA